MTKIPVSSPISPAERIPVRSDELFAGENQFNIQAASTPADLGEAEATLLSHEPSRRMTGDEVIVGFAPGADAARDRAPLVMTPRAKGIAKFAGVLAAGAIMVGIGLDTTSTNNGKASYQNAINERAAK